MAWLSDTSYNCRLGNDNLAGATQQWVWDVHRHDKLFDPSMCWAIEPVKAKQPVSYHKCEWMVVSKRQSDRRD